MVKQFYVYSYGEAYHLLPFLRWSHEDLCVSKIVAGLIPIIPGFFRFSPLQTCFFLFINTVAVVQSPYLCSTIFIDTFDCLHGSLWCFETFLQANLSQLDAQNFHKCLTLQSTEGGQIKSHFTTRKQISGRVLWLTPLRDNRGLAQEFCMPLRITLNCFPHVHVLQLHNVKYQLFSISML